MKLQLLTWGMVNLLLGSWAFASLGEDANSVMEDAQFMNASPAVTRHSRYELHEINKNWVRVHEFEAADGKVFALAWQGQKHPDLSSLLGSHLSEFQGALTEARKTHHHGGSISITVEKLHLEMGGRMGAVYGKVWLTDQMPAGMDLREIK